MKIDVLKMLLSICEFLDFSRFEIRQMQIAFSGTRKQVVDGNGVQYDLRDAFQAFLRFGGMPGITEVGLDQEKAMTLLDGIYSTVGMRDILERERRRGRQITDPILLRRIILYLADNIGSSISAGYIHQTRIA